MEIGNRDGIKQKLYLTVIFIIVVFMVSSIFVKKKGAGDDNLKNSVLAGESSEKVAEEGLSPTLTNVSAESIEVAILTMVRLLCRYYLNLAASR